VCVSMPLATFWSRVSNHPHFLITIFWRHWISSVHFPIIGFCFCVWQKKDGDIVGGRKEQERDGGRTERGTGDKIITIFIIFVQDFVTVCLVFVHVINPDFECFDSTDTVGTLWSYSIFLTKSNSNLMWCRVFGPELDPMYSKKRDNVG
jgi:hypothetical protein